MFKFLFIIFLIFVLFVFLFGFSIVRLLFGGLFSPRPGQNQQRTTQQQQTQNRDKNKTQTSSKSNAKKIIDSDEGEYVDYVEIKD
jgi:flagellar biosynthesis/type III secretory pathway M-ring protein FliF/YscJ